MRPSKRRRPQLEALEAMTLLSAAMPHGAAQVAASSHKVHLALNGSIGGPNSSTVTNPDVGASLSLDGSGRVAPLGQVSSTGSLHMTGFIKTGHATGTLTLEGPKGSVTLALEGPSQAGFSGPPSALTYTITGGTGPYAGATGRGTATLTTTPEQRRASRSARHGHPPVHRRIGVHPDAPLGEVGRGGHAIPIGLEDGVFHTPYVSCPIRRSRVGFAATPREPRSRWMGRTPPSRGGRHGSQRPGELRAGRAGVAAGDGGTSGRAGA